ncbi:hypothetical protein ISCGN_004141 [Ixodes scapularis]
MGERTRASTALPRKGCTEPCQRCGHAHATVDCTQRKTYAAVTQSTAARPSCVQPQETATAPVVPPASEQRKDDPSPPVCPQDVPPLQGNPVAVDNSQLSDAGSLSSDADRLVVVEDDEVTPGQGHPPSSPTSPRVSATPNTLEQLSAKAASAGTPAGTPAGASSAVDTTMECDRQEVKRGFSSSSSGSEAPSSAVAKKKRLVCKDSSPGDSDLEGYRDFNCVLDAYRDIRGPGQGRANWNARELGRLVGQFDLRDVWCELHGSTFAATWSRAASSSRLDRAYFPAALVPYVLRCEVLSFPSTVGYVSDHYPLLLSLAIPGADNARCMLWRLDVRLLRDQDAVRTLRRDLVAALQDMGPDPERWDSLKVLWRTLCVREGRWSRRQLSDRLAEVLRRIRIVQRGGSTTPLMQEYLDMLRARYSRILRGHSGIAALQPLDNRPVSDPEVLRYLRMTRSGGDMPRHIPSVTLADGANSSLPGDIERVFYGHFSALSESDRDPLDGSFNSRVLSFCGALPLVPELERDSLARPITLQEASEALRCMKSGSSPGTDGLPTEFYREFWPQIGAALVVVFNAFLRGGGVPDSFRRGRIVLLPKEGILAAVLVRRLRDILPGLISPYQTCSVPGRTIFSSLSLTRDVFQYATSRGLRGAFVSLDQEKAFDRLEHHFLFSILRAFGFPADFVRLFEVLYANLVSDLVINGRVTPCFPVARGVRQGCPLSPVLFVLCLDPLLRRINDHPSVRGFPLPGSGSLRVSAYADDVSLFVRDSDSLVVIFRLYEEYAALSGARLNTSKSKALIFGGFSDPLPGGIPTTAVVRVLGVLFDCSGVSPDTWAGIVADVTHQARSAACFSLPLRDRAYVVKSVLCAKLWFVARVARPPPTIVRRLNSVIFSFFWEQRTELVVRQALRLPRTSGGWGLPCLTTFSRILALRGVLELLEDPDYPGRNLVLYWLGTHRRILVPRGLGNLCPTAEAPSPFYVATVRTHQQLVTDVPDADVLDTPASRLCEALCAPEVPLLHQVQSRTSDWACALSPDLPTAVADFHWRLGWGVLPTRDRLARWGVSASNLCPNCGALETNVHVVFDCVVARTFWTLVSRMFALPLGRHFRARRRSSRLVFAVACFILWQNRNTAVARGRRLGRMFPMIRRLRILLLSHLEDALFVLGEEEFLRRWHTDFITIRFHRPVLGGALPL